MVANLSKMDKNTALDLSTNSLFSAFEGLVTTEDLQTQIERGEETSTLVLLGEQMGSSGTTVPEYKFRLLKSTKNPLLQIGAAGGNKENIREIQFDLYAVRGIVVKFGHDFNLYDGERTVCRTVAVAPGTEEPIHYDPFGVLPRPMYSPNEYGAEKQASRETITANPLGSRGFSCRNCVENGLNTLTKGVTTAQCGGTTNIVMAVTHVCIQQPNMVTKKSESKWIPVSGIKTMDGQQVFDTQAVIVNISFGKASSYFGKKAMKFFPASVVPAEVMGWGELLNYLYEERLITSRVNNVEVNQRIIPAFVEMWATPPVDPSTLKNTACMPGFRILPDGINTEAMAKIVQMGYESYKSEFLQYGGKLDDKGLPTYGKFTEPTPESETKAIKEALKTAAATSGVETTSVAANPFAATAVINVPSQDIKSAEVVESAVMPDVFSR